MSAGFVVLTSVMPTRSATIAIAVCQSSMTAILLLYSGSQNTSYGLVIAAMSSATLSVRQPMPVV